MFIDCDRCFHDDVCRKDEIHPEKDKQCEHYINKDMTVTLPIFDAGSQNSIRNMQAKGYCFVNSEFLSQLVKDSGELASYKAKAFVSKKKGR